MSGTVLVTGGFGLVGSATVRRLTELGRRVIIAELDTRANRKAAKNLPAEVTVQWANLTDGDHTARVISEAAPEAIIHLAAMIPPAIYKNRPLARRINVDATATLVGIAEAQPKPPRFVHASSNAVFGARNPYLATGPVTADMPMRCSDLYSTHKAEADAIVRASSLEWVVLRLGGVLSVAPNAMPSGRKGNPNNDEDWFVTDWMDTTRAQQALGFQHHSWPDMLDEAARQAGPAKYLLRIAAPLVRAILKRRSAYWKQPGQYADLWGAIRRKIGDPSPDS
ncbi:MAG: NAD-dependent epimerase/dehydratase family protein [Actinomycetia bacterium]|nr:NAD-dependent epimerase/dehydratase family protein [Actinomycetes bacterium]